MRLNKYIASCGICSRRDADKLIDEGRVTVDGNKPVMGMQVDDSNIVMVDGVRISLIKEKTVLAYYKEVGVVCSERDEHASKLITDVLKYPKRLTYAGRLDKDSEGLIIMTDDGDIIEAMMRGSKGHEKEYIVQVDKTVTEDFIKKMSDGIFLEELNVTTRKCTVSKIDENVFSIILTQGFNRQIRRMCDALGMKVISLKRIRVVNIRLNDLKPGEYREIEGKELSELYRACGMKAGS